MAKNCQHIFRMTLKSKYFTKQTKKDEVKITLYWQVRTKDKEKVNAVIQVIQHTVFAKKLGLEVSPHSVSEWI